MKIIHNITNYKKKIHNIRVGITDSTAIPEQYRYRWKGLALWNTLRTKGLSSHAALKVVQDQYGLSPAAWYRIKKRYHSEGIGGVVPHSSRPHPLCERIWTDKIVNRICKLRNHPDTCRWGAHKLRYQLLREQRESVPSRATIERIIAYLKATNQIIAPHTMKKVYKKHISRPHGIRYKKDDHAHLRRIQIDTDHYHKNGVRWYLINAVYVPTRTCYARAYSSASAGNATDCLQRFLATLPQQCIIDAIQVDGGSEFKGVFEAYCQKLSIALLVNQPRTPKQNCYVERLHKTLDEECMQVYDMDYTCQAINEYLSHYLLIYNNDRYHSSIGMTPAEKMKMMYTDSASRMARAA